MVAGPRFDYVAAGRQGDQDVRRRRRPRAVPARCSVAMGKEPIAENAALVAQLAAWGVTANKDLVLDTSGVGQIFGLSEVVPLVSPTNRTRSCAPMKGVRDGFPAVALARCRRPAASGQREKLFSSSENSFATTNLSSREIQIDPAKDKKGPFNLGRGRHSGGQSRIVVVGSSSWVANSFLGFNGNRDLFLNMVNWLSSDEELISIRPKDPEDRRLALSRSQMAMIFYTSVLLLPLAVIAAGVSVWWKRR